MKRYWIKVGHKGWEEVDKEGFARVEQRCGFQSKSSGLATGGFSYIPPDDDGERVEGRITYDTESALINYVDESDFVRALRKKSPFAAEKNPG
jgi:hypothetical protein